MWGVEKSVMWNLVRTTKTLIHLIFTWAFQMDTSLYSEVTKLAQDPFPINSSWKMQQNASISLLSIHPFPISFQNWISVKDNKRINCVTGQMKKQQRTLQDRKSEWKRGFWLLRALYWPLWETKPYLGQWQIIVSMIKKRQSNTLYIKKTFTPI